MAKKKEKKKIVPWLIGGALLLILLTKNKSSAAADVPEDDSLPGEDYSNDTGSSATIVTKNPGAILRTNIGWQGEVNPLPGYEKWENFDNWKNGWRAFVKNSDYHIKNGAETLSKFINRHATGYYGTAPNYVAFVSQNTGVGINDMLPEFSKTSSYINKMWPILREMAIFEAGTSSRGFYETQKAVFEEAVQSV
jgi:hypothetical protein